MTSRLRHKLATGQDPLSPAPECAVAPGVPRFDENNLFVPAGMTRSVPGLQRGERAKFQCCIHPWMQSEITGK